MLESLLIKLETFRGKMLLKRDSNAGVFLWNLYEFYSQSPVRFLDFLANPSEQTFFLNGLSLYVYYFLLVTSLFFKDCIFSQVLQICNSTRCILWYLEFSSITLFANKLDNTTNKEWWKEAISFRMQKENSCLSNLEQGLKYFGVKFQWFYIMAVTTIPVPDIGFSNCFVLEKVQLHL